MEIEIKEIYQREERIEVRKIDSWIKLIINKVAESLERIMLWEIK